LAATVVAIAIALSVLYWKPSPTVHALPASLAPLKLAAAPQPVPAVALTGPGGHLKNLAEFKGRVVLLNLWAPWCGPCVKELPELAKLQMQMPADRFVVVPVDVGRETQADAQAFLNAHKAGVLTTFSDPNAAVARALGGPGLPVTILIDAEGKEIARAEGAPNWLAPDSVAYLTGLLAK